MTWYYLVAIAVLAVCVLRGVQVGLIRSACGLLAVLAAMVLAAQGAELLANPVADAIAAPITQVVEQQMTSALTDAFGEAALDAIDGSALFSSEEIIRLLQAAGLYESVAGAVDSAVSSTLSTVIPTVSAAIAQELSGSIAYGLVYACIFALVLVIGRILSSVLNLADRVPGIHFLNRAGGGIFGLLKGAAILLALWLLLQQLGFLTELGQTAAALLAEDIA